MDVKNEKCVLVLDETMPAGILANTAVILGITLGKKRGDMAGQDVTDQNGNVHPGIVECPVPVLRSTPEALHELRKKLYEPMYQELTVVDFSDLAQSCLNYEDYTEKMAREPEDSLGYFGIGLCGSKKLVNKLTGSLPLLR